MKKTLSLFLCVLMLAVLCSLAACNSEKNTATEAPTDISAAQPTDAPTDAPTSKPTDRPSDERQELNVLFIGNSYTYYNNMSTTFFRGMVTKHGYKVYVDTILSGGYTLEAFANPADEFGAKVAKALDPANVGKYDYVVLQEQSMRPALDNRRDQFFGAVRKLCAKIRAIGAEPVLYSTWGRKEGSEDLGDMTNESMTWRLAAAYDAIAKELDIKVAHVGLAFFDVVQNNKDIELYDPDMTHPSPLGSYLAAATIFSTIFGSPSAEVTDYDPKIEESVKAILDEAARAAVFETPEIPEEYRLFGDAENADE